MTRGVGRGQDGKRIAEERQFQLSSNRLIIPSVHTHTKEIK